MSNPCPVCNAAMSKVFHARLLGKYDADYFHCTQCGLLRTEAPYWLDDAYSDAIALTDTGLVQRNNHIAARLAPLLYFCFEPDGAYLDVAGGYGMLVRLMRDHGFDHYWEDKYCANLMARGFEADRTAKPFCALTAFEVLEHVHEPMEFIDHLFESYRSRTLIFSTELYAGAKPPESSWWYYAFETGQHVCFYQHRTWERIAGHLGLRFFSFNGLHILTDRQPNPLVMKAVSGKLAAPLAHLVRLRLGSRVQADHRLMINQLG